MPRKNRHAYILILPSLFTTGNLFCGFYAIVRSMNHDLKSAAFAILLAGIFDVLDGRVARITRSQSQFGMEYDSIADVVSFGVAPAILAYAWVLHAFGRVGWAAAFFFAACGALRLARFNAFNGDLPKSYFIGLPTPAAAYFVASIVIAYLEIQFRHADQIVLGLMFLLGLLMVSNIRYRSFKDFDLRHRRSFIWLVFIVALVAFIAVRPEISIAMVIGYYVLWGPVREVVALVRSRSKRATTKQGSTHEVGKTSSN